MEGSATGSGDKQRADCLGMGLRPGSRFFLRDQQLSRSPVSSEKMAQKMALTTQKVKFFFR
jgi:hypothetical protein